jgi:hypothetical protein
MFVLGATGFLHELLLTQAERPFVLALCGALMGLPFVIAADRLGFSQEAKSDP